MGLLLDAMLHQTNLLVDEPDGCLLDLRDEAHLLCSRQPFDNGLPLGRQALDVPQLMISPEIQFDELLLPLSEHLFFIY